VEQLDGFVLVALRALGEAAERIRQGVAAIVPDGVGDVEEGSREVSRDSAAVSPSR
jgi:hypothetical protein